MKDDVAAAQAGASPAASSESRRRVPWNAVIVFVAVSFGLAWLVALPLWMSDPEAPDRKTMFTLLAGAMMFTPAIAALLVTFLMRVPGAERARSLGIWPLRPARRVLWFAAAMLIAPALLVGVTVTVAAAFGWLQLDLQHFSGFRQAVEAQLVGAGRSPAEMPPIGPYALAQLVAIPFIGLFNVVTLTTFGEELAWRGWLLPALRPLGVWPALLLSGAIWGLWHTPIILLGYNFNRTDAWGVVLMTAGGIAWGTLFGWLRLRTGSLWPSVVAHGVFNAAGAIVFVVLPAAGHTPNMALANPLGVSGWIVVAIVVAILAATGQFSREPQLAASRKRDPARKNETVDTLTNESD